MNKILILLLLFNCSLWAATSKTQYDATLFNTNSELFYEIGGANKTKPPLINNTTSLVLGADATASLGYSCGKFDPSLAFANTMDDLKNGVDDAVDAVIASANAAIASLPAWILKRAQPLLYDLFQEYKADALYRLDVATKSCEQMEAEIANGKNPYADYLQSAKLSVWREESDKANSDAVKTKKKADEEANGTLSFGGEKRGGEGQQPLKLIEDTIFAGYNFTLGEKNPVLNTQAPADSELANQFSDAKSAADWTTDVIGEFEINNNVPITKVGSGLYTKVAALREEVLIELEEGKFSEWSINTTVENKIKRYSQSQQDVILALLAEDIAVQQVIDKALTIRRLLLAGSQEVNVVMNTSNSEQIDKNVAHLEKEIDSLMFEWNVRNDLTNNTIARLLSEPELKGVKATTEPGNLFIQ